MLDWIYFIGWLVIVAFFIAVIYKSDPEPQDEGGLIPCPECKTISCKHYRDQNNGER